MLRAECCAITVAVPNTTTHHPSRTLPDNLLENVAARGAQLRKGLEAIQKEYPSWVKDVRGWGLITGLEISDDQVCSAHYAAQVRKRARKDEHVRALTSLNTDYIHTTTRA